MVDNIWNIGSLLGIIMIIIIISGITISMHYTANIIQANDSIEQIMREINNGWIMRYIHNNGVTLIFIQIYQHMGKAIYYGTNTRRIVWNIGQLIYIQMMITAFQGYILPWGQMSYWGACVITNQISVIPYIGEYLVNYIWGGYSIVQKC